MNIVDRFFGLYMLLTTCHGTNVRVPLDSGSGSSLALVYISPESEEIRSARLNNEEVNVFTDMIPVFGSVAFHTTHSHGFDMILNSTDENFRASCVDDSIVVGNTDINHLINMDVSFVDESTSVESGTFRIGFETIAIGSIPALSFDYLVNMFVGLGAHLDPYDTNYPSFHNCDSDLLVQLPTLDLLLSNGGRIPIEPTEYVSVNQEYKICQLEVRSCDTTNDCFFNPLAIRNKNIRLSSQHTFEFCDSL